MVPNPFTVTNSGMIARSGEHEGQSQSSLVDCQNPCQKPDDTELESNDFIDQDQSTCPDLGESNP